MEKRSGLTIAAITLVILGIVMVYLGLFNGPKMLPPPAITGIGFFIIAWVFIKLRN